MYYGEFAKQIQAAGLQPFDKGMGHWQVRGGYFTVNFYPERGTIYVNGTTRGFHYKKNPVLEVIAAARTMPPVTPNRAQRLDKRHRGIRKRLLFKSNKCYWCSFELTLDTSTLDHKIPLSRGGSYGDDNLCLACPDCNHDRKNDMPEIRTDYQI